VVLKEYNEALLQYKQICALPAPEPSNMNTFHRWLREPTAGKFCIQGEERGREQDTWGPLYPSQDVEEPDVSLKWQFVKMLWSLIWPKQPPSIDLDLVATRPDHKIDGFTRWVADEFVPFHHSLTRYRDSKRRKSQDPENTSVRDSPAAVKQETLTTYSEKAMLRFTSSVSTVIACLLPTVAIAVLSKVHGLNNLLVCLAAFATLFSVGLIYLTNATTSRVEIFTATAAFSAVLVVFISVPTVPSTPAS